MHEVGEKMFWFRIPSNQAEQSYVDIENGVLPVLSPDTKKSRHTQQQDIVSVAPCKTFVPMPPPVLVGELKSSSTAASHSNHRYSNMSELPMVEAIACPKATAPPDSFDASKPILISTSVVNLPCYGPINNNLMNQRTILPRIHMYARHPVILDPCPLCGAKARTFIITSPSWITWMLVVVWLLVFWPLFWIPLVLDSCKRTRHYCSRCSGEVGELEALSDCCVRQRR